MQRTSALRAFAAATLLAAALVTLTVPAGAGSAHGTGIGLPSTASVGQTIDATIVITNASTPPESGSTHTISSIEVTPSCAAGTLDAEARCPSPDADVFEPSAVAAGMSNSACAGVTFSVSRTTGSTTGAYRLTPTVPVVLAAPNDGPSDECHLTLTLTARRMPTIDATSATGMQTIAIVSSVGTSNLSSTPGANTTSFASGAQPITIVPAVPSLSTQVADGEVVLGDDVSDAAVLAGGASPTGTLRFDLYGPDDEDCSGTPVASSTHPVTGAGTYASAPHTPTAAGTFRFVARYSGDADDQAISGSCNDPNEAVVVSTAEPPGIRVIKTATPLSRPEPGGTFSFSVAITNTSAVPLTITALTDDVYGDLAPQGTCTEAVGTTLAPGDSYACAFPGELTGNAGTTQTDVVTVRAVDDAGAEATDDDDAVVSITDVPPTVGIVKTALPEARVAPGGLFTFGVELTNTSAEPVTVTSLVDDVYGDLAHLTSSSCAALVGRVLQPAEQVGCTFEGQLTGEVGAAQTDVVTVTVTDDDGSTGTSSDDATVRLIAADAPATTAPSTPTVPRSTAPTTAGRPRLATTGAGSRQTGLLAGGLLGLGLIATGLSVVLDRRRT